jgi:hypothetical protein
MIWQDILIEGNVTNSELTAALALVLRVKDAELVVVSNMERVGEYPIICHRQEKGGTFSLLLSIYTKPQVVLGSPIVIAEQLSFVLGCRLLIESKSRDPYVMRLVSDGVSRNVDIDVAALDERDEYELA